MPVQKSFPSVLCNNDPSIIRPVLKHIEHACIKPEYFATHGKAPNYAQIAAGCGIRPGTVAAHLSYLEARGLIRRADNTRRGITLRDVNPD